MTPPERSDSRRPANIPADSVKISPGLYGSPDGTLHIWAAELLEANGWEATPENEEIILKMAAELGNEQRKPMIVEVAEL